MKIIGIYKIISPSGRIYIGQSRNVLHRFIGYRNKNANKTQVRLKRSFLKYGVDNHTFEVIETCESDQLNLRERHWQEFYDVTGKNGLNCYLTETSKKPREISEQTRQKMKNAVRDLRGYNNPRYGIKMTQELRDKIKNSKKGKHTGEEHCNVNIILNFETGIYYFGSKEASNAHNVNDKYLDDQLAGRKRNKTMMKRVGKYKS